MPGTLLGDRGERVRRRGIRRRALVVQVAIVLVLVVVPSAVCVAIFQRSWYLRAQREWQVREWTEANREVGEPPVANHPAVARLLDEARGLEAEWHRQLDGGSIDTSAATLVQATDRLHQAVRVSQGLARTQPRREAIAESLNEFPWAQLAPIIRERKGQLDARYTRMMELIANGHPAEADRIFDELLHDLSLLCRDSVKADRAAAARAEYETMKKTLSDRLRSLGSFTAAEQLAAGACDDWQAGNWDQAARGYGQALQNLETLRAEHETAEERIARTDGPEREREFRNQLEQVAAERASLRETVRQRDAQVAELNRVWLEDRAKASEDYSVLSKDRDKLENQLASERKHLDALTTEKLDLANQLAAAHGERKQAKQDAESWRTRAEAQQKRVDELQAALIETTAKLRRATGIKPGETVLNSIGMKLQGIPAGKFTMGASMGEKGYRDWEGPRHTVTITEPFLMGVYEVTQHEYEAVMGKNPAYSRTSKADGPNYPVEQVTWNDAVRFCEKLTALPAEREAGRVYRLPTEGEWEFACRAGTTTEYYFGRAMGPSQANVQSIARPTTVQVGSYKANSFGLYDMHGNVWEWCGDFFGLKYYKESPPLDPQGAAEGHSRVLRGGSWQSKAENARASSREPRSPLASNSDVGFRVVCEMEASRREQTIASETFQKSLLARCLL